MIKQNNRILKNMDFTGSEIIKGYIHNLEKRYNIHISIDDLMGISEIDFKFEEIFRNKTYHNNAFCNTIKKNNKGFCLCVDNKNRVVQGAKKSKTPFYGSCYMGIEEFVYPVKWEGKLVALIMVGQFCTDLNQTQKRLENQIALLGLNRQETLDRFLKVVSKIDFNIQELAYDLGILGEYITQIYINYFVTKEGVKKKDDALERVTVIHNNHFIVSSTMGFINENYNRELSLQVLAANCYCNATYLSHIFKEKLGVTLVEYINQVRIDHAKEILDITNKSVTEVSLLVGFNDSSYFAKVFKRMTGKTPRGYRDGKSE